MSASNPQLIVLYCIIGAAGSVTIAYAVSRLYGKNSEDDTAPRTLRNAHDQQRVYMRDVRMHNRMLVEQEAMEGRPGKRPGHTMTEISSYA
jgi:hypothetical protein